MKKSHFFYKCIIILCMVLLPLHAQAGWVDITSSLTVSQPQFGTPYTDPDDGSVVTPVTVAIYNPSDVTEEGIAGELRLLVDGEMPLNPDGIMGEDGSSPTAYFDINTSQIGLFEPEETVTINMNFAGEGPFNLTLTVQVNDSSIYRDIFRKKISKTPEFYSGEAGIEIMPIYVNAQNTKGVKYYKDADGNLALCEADDCGGNSIAQVKPIIITYLQEEEDAAFNSVPDYTSEDSYAHDVYAAVSLDDGLTWKRTNISRTARKSSFQLENGVHYLGDSETQDVNVVGPYVFVTWLDKFCRSGNPWDIEDEEDIFQVTGPQRSVDYLDVHGDDEPRPDLGVRPFSCIWGARGVLIQDETSSNFGTIKWYKAEQLSTGRRDAMRNFNAGIEPVLDGGIPKESTGGFAVSWQEDPKGLKTGKGRGPGAGMSGACVNHKTDIWYSYINWTDFSDVDPDFVASDGSGDGDPTGDDGGNTEYICTNTECTYVYDPEVGDPEAGIAPGTKFIDLPETWVCPKCLAAKDTFEKDSKPHALNKFSVPMRVSDNAVCRERIPTDVEGYMHNPDARDNAELLALYPDLKTCDYTYEGGTSKQPTEWDDLPDDWVCPKCGAPKDTFISGIIRWKHVGAPYCEWFKDNPRVDRDGKYMTVDDIGYIEGRYCLDGEWVYADTNESVTGGDNTLQITVDEEGKAFYEGREVVWTGEPLDGNTGASRANLSLVNWDKKTLAVMAYEETKGIGEGSDKAAEAPEQKAPIPLMVELGTNEDGTYKIDALIKGPYTNSDCVSCHYVHEVPVDRLIPAFDKETCEAKGAVWDESEDPTTGLYPYSPYPLPAGYDPADIDISASKVTRCVKFEEGMSICPKDSNDPDCYYKALPTQLPGWHSSALDCAGCHLPYGTKDIDEDTVADLYDKCLGTASGAAVDTVKDSETYGCSTDQTPGEEADDDEKKERHGKNIFYHNYPFNLEMPADLDLKNLTVQHGYMINKSDENARRVRVVPNSDFGDDAEPLTLGLLYKQGIGGQGSPADAYLQVFKNGFDPADIVEHYLTDSQGSNVSIKAINLSSSTPLSYKEPTLPYLECTDPDNPDTCTPTDTATDTTITNPDYDEDQSGHKTPKVEEYEWHDANLADGSGWKLFEDLPDPVTGEDILIEDENGFPAIEYNPYENVFSTRLDIRGDTVFVGYAYCVNWSAAKKAKDHYDFFGRVSNDGGTTWTLPFNITKLKNHMETVSDCRVLLPPPTIDYWKLTENDEDPIPYCVPSSSEGVFTNAVDINNSGKIFFGIGTKENTPQPNPNVTELEENEIFLDLHFARATISGENGGEYGDLTVEFDYLTNYNYDSEAKPYIDQETGEETDEACFDYDPDTNECIEENKVNPKAQESIEADWIAKGDAFQGDIQVKCSADGNKFYSIWEQELAFDESEGQSHFQGADVWFRKIYVPDVEYTPPAEVQGDLDGDSDVDFADRTVLFDSFYSTPTSPKWNEKADLDKDSNVTFNDYRIWYGYYNAYVNQ